LFGQWTGKRASGENDRIHIDCPPLGVHLSDPTIIDLKPECPGEDRSTSIRELFALPAMGTLILSKYRARQGLTKPERIKTMALIRQMEQVGDRWR
jgi:hypothetical protein